MPFAAQDQLHSPKASIRIDDWKLSLAFYFNASKTDGQLYDLATDEEEAHDVDAANPVSHLILSMRGDLQCRLCPVHSSD